MACRMSPFQNTHTHCVHLEWQSAIRKWNANKKSTAQHNESGIVILFPCLSLSVHIWTGTSYQVAYVQMNKINWHKYRQSHHMHVCVCSSILLLNWKYANSCMCGCLCVCAYQIPIRFWHININVRANVCVCQIVFMWYFQSEIAKYLKEDDGISCVYISTVYSGAKKEVQTLEIVLLSDHKMTYDKCFSFNTRTVRIHIEV